MASNLIYVYLGHAKAQFQRVRVLLLRKRPLQPLELLVGVITPILSSRPEGTLQLNYFHKATKIVDMTLS